LISFTVELDQLVDELSALGGQVRDRVIASRRWTDEPSCSESGPEAGDVAYDADIEAEKVVHDFFDRAVHLHPVVVITEDKGVVVVPAGASADGARWRVIIDPVDGTRELAWDMRSAWFLAGVAPNKGPSTTLADIEGAVQVEIPPSSQTLSVTMTATREGGTKQMWWDLAARSRVVGPPGPQRPLRASTASTIRGGFAVFVDFFPGNRKEMMAIADEVFEAILLDPPKAGEAAIFNDQYISSGGQMYLLATGRYRCVIDIRADVDRAMGAQGTGSVGLCAHPYDLAAGLIATRLGVVLTDIRGESLSHPLDNVTNCSWVGYANEAIKTQVKGPLIEVLKRHQVI